MPHPLKPLRNTASLSSPTARVVGDLLSELDTYSLVRSRVVSRGRYGRTREIILDLPDELVEKILEMIVAGFEVGR